jgi:hypothetical protein
MGYAEDKAYADEYNKRVHDALAQMGGIMNSSMGASIKAQIESQIRADMAQQVQRSRIDDSTASVGFNYGQDPNAAANDIARYRGANAAIQQRAPTLADYAQANRARGSQTDALGMYRNAALGQGPSAAQAQLQQGLDRGLASNLALANSARGGALALAQGRLAATGQNANMVVGNAAQAAQLRAQEQQQGLAGYAGLAGQLRGQDVNAAQFNAEMALRSRGLNDTTGLAYETLGQGVQGMQMQGALSREAAISGNVAQQQQYAAQIKAQADADSARAQQMASGVASAAIPIVGGLANYVARPSTTRNGLPDPGY